MDPSAAKQSRTESLTETRLARRTGPAGRTGPARTKPRFQPPSQTALFLALRRSRGQPNSAAPTRQSGRVLRARENRPPNFASNELARAHLTTQPSNPPGTATSAGSNNASPSAHDSSNDYPDSSISQGKTPTKPNIRNIIGRSFLGKTG
jgi:hypothetical protein